MTEAGETITETVTEEAEVTEEEGEKDAVISDDLEGAGVSIISTAARSKSLLILSTS